MYYHNEKGSNGYMGDSNNDYFMKYVYDLYEKCVNKNDFENKKVSVKPKRTEKGFKSWFKWLFVKKQEKVVYPQLKKTMEDVEFFISDVLTPDHVPSFDMLWSFCLFVRMCEKIFFISNSPEDKVYSEVKFDDKKNNPRKLRIKLDNSEVRLTLEHNVLGSDIITINVVRDFGLKMENSYQVIDSDMRYDDSSDLFLINEINSLLMRSIRDKFVSVVELILEKGEFDKSWIEDC